MKEVSLNELRRISARQNETHNQLNAIIDQRKGELRAAQEQLYVQIESFRTEQQHEIRNEIGVAVDFALKALPWWRRWNRKNVLAEAFGYMVDMREMRIAEAARVKAEIDAEAKKIEDERNQEAVAKARKEFEAKAAAEKHAIKPAETVKEVSAMTAGPFDKDGNVVNLDDHATPPMGKDGVVETRGTVSHAELVTGDGKVLSSKEFDTAKSPELNPYDDQPGQ